MNHLPFDKPGIFLRGNLHTHSTRSDGTLSPEQVCKFYQDLSYDFLAITDHFMEHYHYPITDTRPYRSETFTTLIGAELHAGQTIASGLRHILGVGLPLDFAPPSADETGPQITRRALDAGAYIAVAHPAWYNLTEADVLSLGPDVQAIETINGISADYNDRIDSWYMLDVMLAQGHRYFACATDDTHFMADRDDAARGWVWVKSESREPEAILAALKAGHNYSSTGPQIFDIQVDPGKSVVVRCSPANSVFLTGIGATCRYQHGQGLRQVRFDLNRFNSPYCRITVRDRMGGRAWSNPIWFE